MACLSLGLEPGRDRSMALGIGEQNLFLFKSNRKNSSRSLYQTIQQMVRVPLRLCSAGVMKRGGHTWFLLQRFLCDAVLNAVILTVIFHFLPFNCSHLFPLRTVILKSTYTELHKAIKIFSTDTNYSESSYQISKDCESILVLYIPLCSCSVTLPLNI